jgi:hypothetical protein
MCASDPYTVWDPKSNSLTNPAHGRRKAASSSWASSLQTRSRPSLRGSAPAQLARLGAALQLARLGAALQLQP